MTRALPPPRPLTPTKKNEKQPIFLNYHGQQFLKVDDGRQICSALLFTLGRHSSLKLRSTSSTPISTWYVRRRGPLVASRTSGLRCLSSHSSFRYHAAGSRLAALRTLRFAVTEQKHGALPAGELSVVAGRFLALWNMGTILCMFTNTFETKKKHNYSI